MNLTFNDIVYYLPHNLKWRCEKATNFGDGFWIEEGAVVQLNPKNAIAGLTRFKPFLRPMRNIHKPLFQNKVEESQAFFRFLDLVQSWDWRYEVNGKVLDFDDSKVKFSIDLEEDTIGIPFWIFKELVERHFDVFGLIEKGLALEITETF